MITVQLNRKITSYAKVRALIGSLIRGRSLFIRGLKNNRLEYLDIGCGPNTNSKFINLDYDWRPELDVCWDITKKSLPFKDASFKGVFTEHCFEHISFNDFKKNMKEIFRILKDNGTLRLIMPDGGLYLDIYNRKKTGENIKMPFEDTYISPMHRINGIFRNHGHQFIYDFETVQTILKEVGFSKISKESYNSGSDKMLLRDSEHRSVESLYVEAIKLV